jgi:hypothetical protein
MDPKCKGEQQTGFICSEIQNLGRDFFASVGELQRGRVSVNPDKTVRLTSKLRAFDASVFSVREEFEFVFSHDWTPLPPEERRQMRFRRRGDHATYEATIELRAVRGDAGDSDVLILGVIQSLDTRR